MAGPDVSRNYVPKRYVHMFKVDKFCVTDQVTQIGAISLLNPVNVAEEL